MHVVTSRDSVRFGDSLTVLRVGMSVRPRVNNATMPVSTPVKTQQSPLTMDDLNPVEQAAARLGVDPDTVKPIAWLNEAHYENLKDSNAMDEDLGRRIEAFKSLAKAEKK